MSELPSSRPGATKQLAHQPGTGTSKAGRLLRRKAGVGGGVEAGEGKQYLLARGTLKSSRGARKGAGPQLQAYILGVGWYQPLLAIYLCISSCHTGDIP